MTKEVRKVVSAYRIKILGHHAAINALKSELRAYMQENIDAGIDCFLEEEPEFSPDTMTIVTVRFKASASKTYDYEFIKVVPTDTVNDGDFVVVEGFNGPVEVEVMRVFEINREQASLDYKPAFCSFDRMCEYETNKF